MSLAPVLAIATVLAIWPFVRSSPQDPPAAKEAPAAKANRYVGAKVCKSCHSGKDKGEAFEKWAASQHSKAFETLASPRAKEIGKKLGIADPQKSDQCVQCHTTAHGEPAETIKKGFKPEDGVQCESCHGPGENHRAIRFAEAQKGGAAAPVAAGEIDSKRDVATCTKCHNEKSPTYQPFCLAERMQQIEHFDPRKKRSEAEIEKLRAGCCECPKCAKKEAAKEPAKDGGK